MSQDRSSPDQHTILADAWSHVVGGMEWLQSVLFGEFADHRPLSAVVADMLVSFIPGVVIVTSARDAVAVILRLATHPERREELMEWMLLCACLIVIALPIAMAAGSAVALGVGAVIGGVAGSELGAALRAVMLMLIKEASKLIELVRFLQKFMKGDILKFLRAVQFTKYEKALVQALSKIIGKLVEIVKALRLHLESLRYFDTVKTTIAKLVEWEQKFYNVQREALRQVPKALAELDARLTKVLAQTAPKEVHTVAAGVQADKTLITRPANQRVIDTPGKALPRLDKKAAEFGTSAHAKIKNTKNATTERGSATTPKEKPDLATPTSETPNTKKQTAADVAAAIDREKITILSTEAREAKAKGNNELAKSKIKEAQEILKPYFPKHPADNWDEVVKRLDVSSPTDGAVFWSGDPKSAQRFAEKINGTTLETTAGGRVIDNWEDVNRGFNWDERSGPGPYARDLWASASEKYAEGASGHVNTVQTIEKLRDPRSLWHNVEKDILKDKLQTGEVSSISMYAIDESGEYIRLSETEMESLLKLKGIAPK